MQEGSSAIGTKKVASSSHPAVKLAASLGTAHGRKKYGLALLEGFRAVEGALDAGVEARAAIMTGGALAGERGSALSDRLQGRGCPVFEVPSRVFSGISLTETPQGIALVCSPFRATLEDVLASDFLVVADRIQDPGNLGAILRSSRAFGAEAVLTTRGTVEVFNPKTLRASAGTWPGLKIVEGLAASRLSGALGKGGFRLLVADSAGKRDYREQVWNGRVALVIGSEAGGVDRVLAGNAESVRIPMKGGVESLNAAAAAAVLLAEAFRVRQLTDGGGGDKFH